MRADITAALGSNRFVILWENPVAMSLRTTTSAPTGHAPVASRRAPRGRVRPSTPRPPAQFRPNAKYVLMLGLMCALPAISTDMYLPSLPDVARDLNTSATAAQLTMTAMLIGGAVGPAGHRAAVGPVRATQAGADRRRRCTS